MSIPIQITLRHMNPSSALDARMRMLGTGLEKFSTQLLQCHVVIEAPHQHSEQGNLFEMRVDAIVPEKQLSSGTRTF
jgi:hypothetical protein